MEVIAITLALISLALFYKVSVLTFQNGYYERTLKNNRHKFSDSRWEGIQKVMDDPGIFG